MSESWQDWDSPEYMEFLEQFYTYQMSLADNIAKGYDADFKLTIFEKIAPPAVYLKAEYEKWKKKQNKDAIPEREPLKAKPKPAHKKTDYTWKPTRTEGTIWKSEQDASEEEVIRAMDPANGDTWYSPPKDGYQYGAIFRKVKP